MKTILVDVGGTHARCAIWDGINCSEVEKIKVSDYPDAVSLLSAYLTRQAVQDVSHVAIASAGRMDQDGVWRVGNNGDWPIDPNALENIGLTLRLIQDDFEASCLGAVTCDPAVMITLHHGVAQDKDATRAVCGPGTGLGLAYAISCRGHWHVHRTHGGHMLATAMTQQQHTVMMALKRIRSIDCVIYEDLASGRALVFLYQACCETLNEAPNSDIQAAYDILNHPDEKAVILTLKLFHEFLGQFLQTIIVTGHAHGGVYLDGGVIQKLYEQDLLQIDTLLENTHLCSNETVLKMLVDTPIYLVNVPYVALDGLKVLLQGEEQ